MNLYYLLLDKFLKSLFNLCRDDKVNELFFIFILKVKVLINFQINRDILYKVRID